MNNYLERIWEEAVVACFKALGPAFVWYDWRNRKSLSKDSQPSSPDLNPGPPEYKARVLTTCLRGSVMFELHDWFPSNSIWRQPFSISPADSSLKNTEVLIMFILIKRKNNMVATRNNLVRLHFYKSVYIGWKYLKVSRMYRQRIQHKSN